MRAVVTRVAGARVEIGGAVTGAIDRGFLILLGVARADTDADAGYLAEKILNLRVFADGGGLMNRSLAEVPGGAVLVVSRFTLLGDVRKGRRPSFISAADPEQGRRLYERFVERLRDLGAEVATGRFGADMQVVSVNDGPVTILIDSTKLF